MSESETPSSQFFTLFVKFIGELLKSFPEVEELKDEMVKYQLMATAPDLPERIHVLADRWKNMVAAHKDIFDTHNDVLVMSNQVDGGIFEELNAPAIVKHEAFPKSRVTFWRHVDRLTKYASRVIRTNANTSTPEDLENSAKLGNFMERLGMTVEHNSGRLMFDLNTLQDPATTTRLLKAASKEFKGHVNPQQLQEAAMSQINGIINAIG